MLGDIKVQGRDSSKQASSFRARSRDDATGSSLCRCRAESRRYAIRDTTTKSHVAERVGALTTKITRLNRRKSGPGVCCFRGLKILGFIDR